MENGLAALIMAIGAGICLIESGIAFIIIAVKDKKDE